MQRVLIGTLVLVAILAVGAYLLLRSPGATIPAGPAPVAALPAAKSLKVHDELIGDLGMPRLIDTTLENQRYMDIPARVSSDFTRVAYVFRPVGPAKAPLEMHITGAPAQSWRDMNHRVRFSADGSGFIYTAVSPTGRVLIVNGKQLPCPPTDHVFLSDDGNRWGAIVVGRGEYNASHDAVIADGVETRTQFQVSRAFFAGKPGRLVYQSMGWHLENDPDVIQQPAVIRIDEGNVLLFGPMGDSAQSRPPHTITCVTRTSRTDFGRIHSLTISQDRKHWACLQDTDRGTGVIFDGIAAGPWPTVDAFGFSPDGMHSFVRARMADGRCALNIDGKSVAEGPELGDPSFSPASSECAWWADEGGARKVYRNAKPLFACPTGTIPLLAFSTDGKLLGCYLDKDTPTILDASGRTVTLSDPNAAFVELKPRVLVRREKVPDVFPPKMAQYIYVNEASVASFDHLAFAVSPDDIREYYHLSPDGSVIVYGLRGSRLYRTTIRP